MMDPRAGAPSRASGVPPGERFVVGEHEAGLRLDAFLVKRGRAKSVGSARKLLEAGDVRLDGRRGRKGDHLVAGQTVTIATADAALDGPAVVPDAELALAVLYEDDALVAVAKTGGMPSHPLRAGERGTAANFLAARYPECAQSSPDAREGGLVHRLDVDTSGVLLAARRREVWQRLREEMGGEGAEKIYLAEIAGRPAAHEMAIGEALVVDRAIGRPGRRADHVQLGRGRGLLPARTELVVRALRPRTTLVEARIRRGRPHQIRAHLASLGSPVLGDDVYSTEATRLLADELQVAELRLHAWIVRLAHPLTGRALEIEAPPPDWA